MIDYSASLYDPIYAEIGVPALMTTTAGVIEITVKDDTRPKAQPTSSGGEVRSVAPGAFARVPELTEKGIDRSDYVNSMLSFNGRMWLIHNYELRGNPNGEDFGEVRFLLRKAD